MEQTAPRISCLPAGENPLSSDVFLIPGDARTYVYDVGRSDEARDLIRSVPGDKVIILSHFHGDHTDNLSRVECAELYAGGYTVRKFRRGTAVASPIIISDGAELEIRPCPSPHAKGSVIVTVDREYTLLGDLVYARPPFDKNLAHMMLLELEKLDTRYFVLSHASADSRVVEKDALLRELREYFSK